jgi:hypothetical protein
MIQLRAFDMIEAPPMGMAEAPQRLTLERAFPNMSSVRIRVRRCKENFASWQPDLERHNIVALPVEFPDGKKKPTVANPGKFGL